MAPPGTATFAVNRCHPAIVGTGACQAHRPYANSSRVGVRTSPVCTRARQKGLGGTMPSPLPSGNLVSSPSSRLISIKFRSTICSLQPHQAGSNELYPEEGRRGEQRTACREPGSLSIMCLPLFKSCLQTSPAAVLGGGNLLLLLACSPLPQQGKQLLVLSQPRAASPAKRGTRRQPASTRDKRNTAQARGQPTDPPWLPCP